MPAARYWRICQIETYDLGDLVLSRLELHDASGRADVGATITSTQPPAAGTLPNLADGNPTTTCTFAATDVWQPGFAIVFDLGAGGDKDVIDVVLDGPEGNIPNIVRVDSSNDGVVWNHQYWVLFSHPGPVSSVIMDNILAIQLLLNMDENFADSSFRSYSVTANNVGLSTTQKKFGAGSGYFNGSSSYLWLPNDLANALHNTPFTIECWVWIPSTLVVPPGNANIYNLPILGQTEPLSNGEQFIGFTKNRNLVVDLRNGSPGYSWNSSAAVDPETWTHVAVTLTGQSIFGFLNGSMVLNASTARLWSNNDQPIYIGRQYNSSYPQYQGYFNGYIDELVITLGAKYTSNFTPPSSALRLPPRKRRSLPKDPGIFLTGSPVGECKPKFFGNLALPQDMQDGGSYRITGTVKRKATPTNLPLARRVWLRVQRDGRLIRQTWSDPVTGAYEFRNLKYQAYEVVAYDHEGNFRAVIADNLFPEPMP